MILDRFIDRFEKEGFLVEFQSTDEFEKLIITTKLKKHYYHTILFTYSDLQIKIFNNSYPHLYMTNKKPKDEIGISIQDLTIRKKFITIKSS